MNANETNVPRYYELYMNAIFDMPRLLDKAVEEDDARASLVLDMLGSMLEIIETHAKKNLSSSVRVICARCGSPLIPPPNNIYAKKMKRSGAVNISHIIVLLDISQHDEQRHFALPVCCKCKKYGTVFSSVEEVSDIITKFVPKDSKFLFDVQGGSA